MYNTCFASPKKKFEPKGSPKLAVQNLGFTKLFSFLYSQSLSQKTQVWGVGHIIRKPDHLKSNLQKDFKCFRISDYHCTHILIMRNFALVGINRDPPYNCVNFRILEIRLIVFQRIKHPSLGGLVKRSPCPRS